MDLATIEEIRQVKYRYLRCVDLKRWDELAEVFTPDATVDYGTPVYGKPLKIAGRDEIVGFLRAKLGPDMITVHRAGQPEITVDGDTASGTWSFEDTVIATEHRIVIVGAAFYQDRYERGEDGRWRIAHTGYVRTYEAMLSLDDLPSFRLTAKPATGGTGADEAGVAGGVEVTNVIDRSGVTNEAVADNGASVSDGAEVAHPAVRGRGGGGREDHRGGRAYRPPRTWQRGTSTWPAASRRRCGWPGPTSATSRTSCSRPARTPRWAWTTPTPCTCTRTSVTTPSTWSPGGAGGRPT